LEQIHYQMKKIFHQILFSKAELKYIIVPSSSIKYGCESNPKFSVVCALASPIIKNTITEIPIIKLANPYPKPD